MAGSTRSEDHDRFTELFQRHERAIYSFIVSLLPNLYDADDVMQETSAKMWRKFHSFEVGSSFRNWAFQFAKYEVMNFRRKLRRDRHKFTDEIIELLAVEAASHADTLEQERSVLNTCIAKLNDRERAILSGLYRKNVRINVHAKLVEETPNAVYKQLARIKKKLMACIQNTLQLEDF